MTRPVVLVLGPGREAVSGVTTHVNLLLECDALARDFSLEHFRIGSEGRSEGALGRWLRLFADPFRLAAAIVRRDAAIVHVNTSLNARAYWRDLAYVAVARALGARVVYQVHGGPMPQGFFPGSRLLAAFLRWTLSWPHVVVTLGTPHRDAYRVFAPGRNVALVPNGIDCKAFLKHARPPLEPQAPLRLLFIGRLARVKGLQELVQALYKLRERRIPARLLIAGSGPDEGWLREQVHALRLKAEVSFLGAVGGEHKARLLALADAFVLPSSHAEGLPYALLEAMAAGAVPVVTPMGAVPDVVTHGVHGLIVPQRDPDAVADAIALLHADRAQLGRMSAACRKRIASAYSIERVAADFSALYSTLTRSWAASRAG
jgi:glycosyltransferase involved in cell wall biosynthesis